MGVTRAPAGCNCVITAALTCKLGPGPTSTCGWLLAEKSVEPAGGCFVSLRICVKQAGCQVSGRVSGPQKSVEKLAAALRVARRT
jgi:hypothetical protein